MIVPEIAAFDVDNVLLQEAAGLCQETNSLYGTSLTVADYHDNWAVMLNITPEEAEARRLELIANGFFERLEPVAGARQGLEAIAARGIERVAITKRRNSLKDVTIASLEVHFGDLISDVVFATYFDHKGDKIVRRKSELCLEVGATSLTDDQHATCLEVASAGITAIHFGDYGWAEPEELHPMITRARDWPAVTESFNAHC